MSILTAAKSTKTPQMTLSEQNANDNKKWYSGEKPTRGETVWRIKNLFEVDYNQGKAAYDSFKTLTNDPTSMLYSPYMSATNNATRQSFAQYGIDASNVNDDWFASNSWMKQYNRVGSTGNILGTANSATKEQNIASLYNDLYEQEQTTKKAETEWASVIDTVRYWTSRADLNMSDEEILNKVDWSKYPTLSKMDAAANAGAPVYLTRAIGYDKDLLKGVIYQTRNNGGSGDLLVDSAMYYGGEGNQYVKDDAVRARFTYGSDSYNPYVVSGTVNDLGLYFGQGSFDRKWLDANADILNGTDETAKKNYHKVQDAVANTEKANGELDALNKQIDFLVGKGHSADIIMATIDRELEEGKYPTLSKLQSSIATGNLIDTAAPINFDYNSIRAGVEEKVKDKGATPEQANEALGAELIQQNGTDAEKSFFADMGDLDFDDQVMQLWAMLESGAMNTDYLDSSYKLLSDSFNAKWGVDAENVFSYQNAEKAAIDKKFEMENTDAFKRLRELGYEGAVEDYKAVNAFMDGLSDEDYEAVWESIHAMQSDLAQLEYDRDWEAQYRGISDEYKADYSALETYRRRVQSEADLSIDPMLRNGEEYSITDTAGLTADDLVDYVMQNNEGVSAQDASAHVEKVYNDEKTRLEKEIATLESSGYTGETLENKKKKLAAVERMLADVEMHNMQYAEGYAEKVAEGKEKVTVIPKDREGYTIKPVVGGDGKAYIAEEVWSKMNEAEKDRYYYLMATNPEDATAYIETLTGDTYGILTYRESMANSEASREFAAEHPILASAGTVLAAPMQIAGSIYAFAQGLNGKEVNPYSAFMAPTAFINQSRAQVTEDIDLATQDNPLLNFWMKVAYSAATSGAESLLFGGVGKAGLPLMVMNGMSSTVQNALERGASTTEALMLGGATGLIEYVTEKLPFDVLTDVMKGSKAAAKTFKEKFVDAAVNVVKAGAQDATGEAISEIAGNIADQWIMQDKSQHELKVQQYMTEKGVLRDVAERAVIKEEGMDVASAFVSGFLSSAGSVAGAETYNALTRGPVKPSMPTADMQSEAKPNAQEATRPNTQENTADAAPVESKTVDPRVAQKMTNLTAAALSRDNPAAVITATMMTRYDATSTVAKAVTIDMMQMFGADTAKVVGDIYGAAYEAGISDEDITNAIKGSLAPDNAEGKAQLQELAKDGASTGKVTQFVANSKSNPITYPPAAAREVLIDEQQRVLFSKSTVYEPLTAARKSEIKAKDAYVKAQKDVGKAEHAQKAAVDAMNKAHVAYTESMSHPDGNVQTSVQHEYLNSIDNVANFNSALEAAKKRAREAKARYDAAIQTYSDIGQKVLADVRAKAEQAVDQALMLAEDKTVNDVMAELSARDSDSADGTKPVVDTSEIRRDVVEQMRIDGMLDELTDITRQINECNEKIAGSRKNNALTKSMRRANQSLAKKRAEIVDIVESIVNEEVARRQQMPPVTVQDEVESVATVEQSVETSAPMQQTAPQQNAQQPTHQQTTSVDTVYDAALQKYGAIEQGEKPVQNIAVPKKIDDERTVSRGQRTFAEAYTEEMVSPEDTKRRVMSGNATYIAQTNEEQIQNAQETIARKGIDEATKQWEASIYDGRIPNAKEMALGICLLDEAVKRGDVAAQDKLSAEFAFAATSAGQTVQASRILKELSGAAGIYYLKKVENKINSQIGGKGRSVSINPDLMTAYSKAKTNEERFTIAQEIKADLAKQIPFTGRDFLDALRYMNMLSNTKTAVTNVSGNLATVPLIAAKDAFAAVIEKVAHVKDKRHSGVLKKEYLDYAKSYAKNNVKMSDGGRFSASLGELQRMRPAFGYSKWAKPLNTLYGGVMKMQEIGDAVFKSPYFTRAMAGYLQAKKVDLKNVSKEVLAKAEDYATERMLENLYQDNNAFVRALNSLANHKVLGWPTRIVMPFIRTAANITRFSVEYNPIGSVVNTVYQANKHGWSSSQVVESAAKGLAGSLPTALGFILRNAGILTLSLGDDPEDEMLRLKGYQEYSIRIGEKSYSLSWAGPMASLLMFGGFLADAADGGMTLEEIGDAGMGTLEVLTDLGVFSGVVDLIDAYSYAKGDTAVAKILDYGKEAAITIGGNYVNQLVKPAFTAAIARTIDPTRRSTVTDPNSPIPESMQYQLYKIRNGTPFLSMTAPAYTDEFGQTQTNSHWNAFIENLVVPGYINDIKDNDPVMNAIEEVFIATGSKDKALIPEKASRSFSESSAKHKLNGDDYARLNKKYGSIIYDTVLKMEQTEEWQSTDALIRSAMLKDLYNYADNASRIDFVTVSPFSETWQKEAYKSGDVAGAILGRAEKYAQTVYGELYGNDLIDSALVDDWYTVQNHWAHLTTAYPYGAGLSEKQAKNRIETEMRTKLQGGEASISPEELDAVETLYYLGMVNESFYKEVTSQ